MAPFRKGLYRLAALSLFTLVLVVLSLFYDPIRTTEQVGIRNRALFGGPQQTALRATPSPDEDTKDKNNRLDLGEDECRSAFPLLFAEIDSAVARGSFVFEKSNPDYKGLVQARIRDGKLSILTAAPDTLPQILHQRTAILSQIHRALITSPTSLPNTTFAFCINDVPKNNTWAFSRPNKASSANTWLMPPFASWSWPKMNLGTLSDALARIDHIEASTPWPAKTDKAVWRGTPWFNPLGQPRLRGDLVRAAKGKQWADVQALDGGNASNSIAIEQFCAFRYVVYTEGVTYSGRLPYHQACESVLIMAPVTWATTSALLLRPVHAEVLMGGGGGGGGGATGAAVRARQRRGGQGGVLGTVADYRDANAVYVKSDFSNLEAVVLFLREHQGVARRIARNQREGVVGRGYLGAAAETCYWRGLIRGWAKVAEVDERVWSTESEVRYETWLLNEVSSRRHGTIGKVGG